MEEANERASVAPEELRVAITGRVVEEGSGRPIPGARAGSGEGSVLTNEEGEFRTEPIAAGRIPLSVSASGFATRELTISHDAERETHIIVELPRGGAIEGLVNLPDGQPAAGAKVRCTGKYGSLSTRTGAGGRFLLEGILITRRNFEVYANLEGHEKTVEVVGFRPSETKISLDIELAQNPDFKPPEKIDLRGRVIDSAGAPVGGANLYLRLADDNAPAAVTDSLGTFVVNGADDFDDLIARNRGFAPSFLDLVELPAEERNAIEIVLGPGQTVAGVVVDARDRPVEDAQIDFTSVGSYSNYPEEYATGPDGAFHIEDLPRSLLGIRIQRAGFLEHGEGLEGKEIEHLKIVLAEAGRIQGIVVDHTTGNPVQTFAVAIDDSDEALFSSADGSFTLEEELTPGTSYTLAVRAKGFLGAPVEEAEAWPITETRDPIRIDLDPGRSLSGRVIDGATGKPVGAVRAIFYPETNRMDWIAQEDPWEVDSLTPATTTDERGDFTLRGLLDSPGKLLLDKPGHGRTVFPKVIPGSAPGVFQFPREAIVEGTVKSRSGDSLAAAWVSVRIDDGFFAGTTDSLGHYRVEGLPPGNATLDARCHGHIDMSRKVVLRPATIETVDFLEAAGSIRGKVTLRGKPASFVTVNVSGLNGEFHFTSGGTDEDGMFRIAGLNPGTYSIAVREAAPRSVKVEDGEAYLEISLPAQKVSGHIVDGASGKPVEDAVVVLHFNHPWMRKPEGLLSTEDEERDGHMSDPEGLASLSGITHGTHKLKVDAEGYFDPQEVIEIAGPKVERTIHLQSAPEIRVELEDPNSTGHLYELVLTALQGGDPGWGWRSTEGNRWVHFDPTLGFDSQDLTARVKTRAGRYRIRADVSPLFELPRDPVYPPAKPVLTEEIDVTVPEAGEATVRLKLPLEQK